MDNQEQLQDQEFARLLEKDTIKIPQVGDIIKGMVVTASKSEVKLDIEGILIGVVRGPEMYNEVPEYADLVTGDEVEAAVIDEENENGELELSFRLVGQEKAWKELRQAASDKSILTVKIVEANKGGLLSRYRQIDGFLPVSQLAPENYPRISGGDKSKILEKLKSFIGQEFEVTVMTLNEEDNKIIFSEKDVWNRKQKPALDKYQVNMEVDGQITAITNFGVFISFGEGIEGLIHISELAWQRIDSPTEMYKVGDKIRAAIISIDGAKVFLSAKKLLKDPWLEASEKYQIGQVVLGEVLKINPFGLFVKLDDEIHGLAHISQLNLGPKEKISELFRVNETRNFAIVSISPSEHRLGLKLADDKSVITEVVTESVKVVGKKSAAAKTTKEPVVSEEADETNQAETVAKLDKTKKTTKSKTTPKDKVKVN